jgi:hypothetical protein
MAEYHILPEYQKFSAQIDSPSPKRARTGLGQLVLQPMADFVQVAGVDV